MKTTTVTPPFMRTPYNHNGDHFSDTFGLKCDDPTLTQQQFKDECDINILFARYLETGEMPQVLEGLSYGDFNGIYDFQTAMNAVRTAEGLFTQLPARIKNRFDNNPQKLLEFLNDEDNREEAIFLGLIDKPKEPTNETGTGNIPPRTEEKGPPAPRTGSDPQTSTEPKKP